MSKSEQSPHRLWSEEEIAALREVYARPPPLRLKEFARQFGREEGNVSRKAGQLGLTSRSRSKQTGRKMKQTSFFANKAFKGAMISANIKRYFAEVGHPQGMRGKKHNAETLARISEASRAQWADPNSKLNTPEQAQRRSDEMAARIRSGVMRSGYSRGRGGKRADLGNRYFRSAWEANYARLLNFQIQHGAIVSWEFECRTFEFTTIKRGTRFYTPDFKVVFADGRYEWHEVKGWMDQASKTRLARMAKFYPDEKIVVVDAASFKAFKRQGFPQMIPTWERM